MAKTPKSGYTETIDGIELEADPSLEGLDDIEGPIDDAWAEEIRKMTVRTTRRDSKKERRIPPSTSESEAPFSLYYARRKKEQRKAITARRDAARLRGLMQNAVDDSLAASLKHLTGQHAQKRHGARQGSTPPSKMFDPPRSAARFRRENAQARHQQQENNALQQTRRDLTDISRLASATRNYEGLQEIRRQLTPISSRVAGIGGKNSKKVENDIDTIRRDIFNADPHMTPAQSKAFAGKVEKQIDDVRHFIFSLPGE